MIVVGVKSPLVVDVEETLARLGTQHVVGVSLGGPVRMMARRDVTTFEALDPGARDLPFLPCAFSPQRRVELVEAAQAQGFSATKTVVDPTVICARSTRMGDGGYVNAGVVIGAAVRIGAFCLVNRSASLGHHCVIEDFASIGPGAILAGNVRVGPSAVIGAGAVVQPDCRIGTGAVVAAGSVVRRDVPDGCVVAGNPARKTRLPAARTQIARTEQE